MLQRLVNCAAISGKIYPSRDEYEAHQERVLARISKHNNQQALSHSIEEGLKIQAMTRYLHRHCSTHPTPPPPLIKHGATCISRLQRGKRHTVENGSGAEDNGDSSHCSNASVHSNQVCVIAVSSLSHHDDVRSIETASEKPLLREGDDGLDEPCQGISWRK